MKTRASAQVEPAKASEHYLKTELYSQVSAKSEIFEFLQAGSLDGIWYLDLERPGNGWMSERYKTLLGYQDHEIPNTASWWRGNIFPEDLPAVLDNFARHCADPNVPFDQVLRHRHKNGSTVWVRCRGFAIRDETGKPIRVIGAHTDVTAFKRTEARLRALYEAAPDMSFVADLETGAITDCNQALRENTGEENIIGLPFTRLCEPDAVSRAESALATLRTGSEVKEIELKLKRKSGGSFTVLFSAQMETDESRSLRAWCRDITHLKLVANLEVLIGALPSGILLVNQQGVVCNSNAAANRIFGYDKGEATGKPLTGLLSGITTSEQHGVRKDGSVFPVHLEVNKIQLDEGTFELVTVADLTTHKGIESALRDSEHRFQQLTESLPQLVWTCAADGTCDYLSPQWVEYTGIAENDQLGSGWLTQVHPDDRASLLTEWTKSVQSGKPFHSEYRLRRHDGTFCWFDSRGIPLRNPQGQIMKWFGTCTDITDRKSIEADQRFLLRLSAALQSISPVRQIAEDATRLLAEHFGAASCALHELAGAPNEARLLHRHLRQGMSPAGFFDNPKTNWVSRELIDQLMAGEACGIDNTATHPFTADAHETVFLPAGLQALILVPLRRKAQTVCILSLGFSEPHQWTRRQIDLAQSAGERIWLGYEAARAQSAQTTLHETLATSERRLQTALQSASIGIWENDPVNNTNTWDARSRLIFGFPPALEVNADLVMSCIHPEDREATQKSVGTFADPEGSGHFAIDYRIISWNGMGIRHVFAQGQMFYEGEGANRRPIRSIGTVQDVTALKKGEEALRRANLELEQFAYAAAHDLQEPLRNVGLATQILANRYKGTFDHDAENLLQTSVEGALRMQAMVKDLLAYSRAVMLEEGAALFADPNVVLALALKNLVVSIEEKQAQISWEKLPNLRMNETHLLQLLQNLISNSLKYSGSAVPNIHVASTTRAGECILLVQDNGLGIPAEYHQRAFGVFKRLHSREVPGTGIGLALCKRIVEHYGGRIWIESQAGEGTTVLFTVPVA